MVLQSSRICIINT